VKYSIHVKFGHPARVGPGCGVFHSKRFSASSIGVPLDWIEEIGLIYRE
jgi:hypothetical protein